MAATVESSDPIVSACSGSPLLAQPIEPSEASALASVLKALSDPARLRLLSLIAAHAGGEACVCDLTAPLGLSQPTVSHHLRKLVEAGLLTREQRGVWAFYAVRRGALEDLADTLRASVA